MSRPRACLMPKLLIHFVRECTRRADEMEHNAKDLHNLDRAEASPYPAFSRATWAVDCGEARRRTFCIAVRLSSDKIGGTWEEDVETVLLSKHGASVRCNHAAKPGETLHLLRFDTGQEVEARVAWWQQLTKDDIRIGVEFVDAENFWGLDWGKRLEKLHDREDNQCPRKTFLKPTQNLLPLETGRKRLFPQERDVIESNRERVPAVARSRFGPHDVSLGHHFHRAAAERTVHQANLDFDRRSRLNSLGTEKKHSTRTDIGGPQRLLFGFPLSGDAIQPQRQAELGAGVRAPLLDRTHGVGGHARNSFRFGPRGPQRRIDQGGRRACRIVVQWQRIRRCRNGIGS